MSEQSELRAAAERVRRIKAGETLEEVYHNQAYPRATNYWLACEEDVKALAQAYLAIVPADSEEPLDTDFLISAGGELQVIPAEDEYPEEWMIDFGDGENEYKLTVWQSGEASINDAPIYLPCSTRREFRALMTGLKIETKEPAQ